MLCLAVGLEFGFRHRLAANVAIHGAVGRELAGPADRAAFFARLGFSVDFEGPALERLKP
jgi:hypothetical protein